MELIEQNESCTEMKRDCKAKGKESLTRTEERREMRWSERRVQRGETEEKQIHRDKSGCGRVLGEGDTDGRNKYDHVCVRDWNV